MRTTKSIRALVTCCLFLAVSSRIALSEDLIPLGANWRYLEGRTQPPADWNQPGFSDADWLSGPAGIGYGDGDDATVLTGMLNNFLTVYTRRSFQVDDPALATTLVLRVSYDDGFVAYLNGEEVIRRGLGNPGDPVASDTPAADHEAAGFDSLDLTAKIPLLHAGTNLLAIEIHNRSLDSGDLSLHPQLAINLPPNGLPFGFAPQTIAGGFQTPVGVAFAPDGRIFVAEKRGRVMIVEGGIVLPTPFLNLEDEVNNAGDRGLLGIALSPNFAADGRVFLLLVVDPVPGGTEDPGESITFGRLVRYTAVGNLADLPSRKVILGNSAADGFIICHSSHSIGTVKFAGDGTIYVGSGDGAHFDLTDAGQDVSTFDPGCASTFGASNDLGAFRAQNLASFAGKILRIDAQTGQGLPDNPYFDGNPASVNSRVWVSGLRNPYRFNIRPGSGSPEVLYIGDVGWNAWEELNMARGGENFGWPCYEGDLPQSSYRSSSLGGAFCTGLSDQSVARPLITWNHGSPGTLGFIGNCAAGVSFYTGRQYPARYRGACFFADYGRNWIKVAWVDDQDRLLAIEDFADDLQRPVDLAVEPGSGDLVYVSIQAGEVRRIHYTVANRPPEVVLTADPQAGTPPLPVSFSSQGSFDPEADPLTFSWDFGDGTSSSSEPNPGHLYTGTGTFTAVLTVTDFQGAATTRSVVIETTNSPPQVSIESPGSGAAFFGGEALTLTAAVFDPEDGENLDFSWEVALHHQAHTHPEWFVSADPEPVFMPVSHGDDGETFYYEIKVRVTDRGGLTASSSRDLHPGSLRRGDGNADGRVDLSDPILALFAIFAGDPAPCLLALDADANGDVSLPDAVMLLRLLFSDGPDPAAPYPGCGVARNPSNLSCAIGCR